MKSLKLKAMAIVAATAVVMSMNGHAQVYANEYVTHTKVVGGKSIEGSLSASSNYATSTITYTQGNGEISTSLSGRAYYKAVPIESRDKTYAKDSGYVSTPKSVSASISAPSDYAFKNVVSTHNYDIEVPSAVADEGDGAFWLRIDF